MTAAAIKTIEERWQELNYIWRFAWHSEGWYGEYKRSRERPWMPGTNHTRTLREAVCEAEGLEKSERR